MRSTTKALMALAMTSALTLSACGGGTEAPATGTTASAGSGSMTSDATTSDSMTSDSMTSDSMTSDDMTTSESMTSDDAMSSSAMGAPDEDLVGAGCADYAAQVPDGAGSVAGMAQDPVAVAAGNNPLLTTLTAAVSGKLNPDVDLVDTLNGGEFTVFAPVDDAFAAVDKKTVATLGTDADLLTKVLTYHVVPGRLSPSEVVGTQTTVEGETLEVTGSGDDLKVNGATVICGGVSTKNATVYLIDEVLMPKM